VTLNDGETGMVMEGKDIGLTVFPKANFKFYLVSDMSARVARRHQDFLDFGQKIAKDKIEREIKLRDDMEIKKSPVILRKAENAIVVDTTNMIVEEQVNYLYRIITNPEADLIQP
jgi:cytidylate kinase